MNGAPPVPARRGRTGLILVGVILAVFVALWGTVIVGHRVLVGGDILYNFQPWAGEPAAREPRNTYVGDPVTQFVEWTGLVRDSYSRGEMPLWNPYTLSGTPLLANDQSSPFSPFTLLSMIWQPARGLSMAMLLKLWVAGLGMAAFMKVHRARTSAAALAGVAYASSSFMVVWLAYPHTGVAAIMPWAFAATAWFLRDRTALALVATAAAIAVQFLAGHAETSLHLGFGLAVYAAVRVIGLSRHRLRSIGGLAVAAGLGCLLAGAQLVPFVANLADASILDDRSGSKTGFTHLDWRKADTWLAPNGEGSPGIDGESSRYPVYPESVGFAGAGAMVLAISALAMLRRRERRWEVLAVLGVLALSAGTIYGVLSPAVGRTPLLDVANNIRFLTTACFAVAALGGLGLDHLLSRAPRRETLNISRALLAIAGVMITGLAVAIALLVVKRAEIDSVLPDVDGRIGFWVATGVAAALAAAALYGARRAGAATRPVAGGFLAVALMEAVLFAWPYNPRLPTNQVLPPSTTIDWLRTNVGDGSVAATGLELIPNVASAYRLRDPRGVDTLLNPRTRTYWSKADPGFDDSFLYTVLSQPDPRWLAAAGVTHYLSPADKVLPGTVPVYERAGSVVSTVPGARPFAFVASATATASDQDAAAEALSRDPLGAVIVERGGPPGAGRGQVELVRRRAQLLEMKVSAGAPATVVVLQSFAEGWTAEVDGRKVKIDPANVLFQSVQVPAGNHTLVLRYEPESFRLGVAATSAGLIGVVLIMGLTLVRSRRTMAQAPAPASFEPPASPDPDHPGG